MTRLAAIALALVLALGGCSIFGRTGSGGRAAFARSTGEEIADYVARLHAMNAAGLAAEAARQRKAAQAGAAGDMARLKAALALSIAPASEDGDILALLDPVLRRPGADREVAGMANFLLALTVERRHLRENAAAATTRLREQNRALEQQRQRADALGDRATELQKKLDALSDLEKSLSNRQPPSH